MENRTTSNLVWAGWIIFITAIVLMFDSLLWAAFYVPLFITSFILSIIMMAKGRLGHGISIIVLTLLFPVFQVGSVLNELADEFVRNSVGDVTHSYDSMELDSTSTLNKVIIHSSQLYMGGEFIKEPVIKIDIENKSDIVLSEISFYGIYKDEDRTLSYAEDNFRYEIPGGLEPGERVTWKLEPGYSSDFYNAASSFPSAKLKVKVVSAEDAKGIKVR